MHRRTGPQRPLVNLSADRPSSMPDLPRQIRLAAGDYFMHGQDHRMRRSACRATSAAPSSNWTGALTWTGCAGASPNRPSWTGWRARASSGRCRCCRRSGGQRPNPKPFFSNTTDQNGGAETPWSLPQVVAERELHAERGPGVAFDVVRHADGTSHLYLSWNHTLLDARGLDFLLSHLNADGATNGAPTLQDFISPKQTARRELPAGGQMRNWRTAR